MTELTWKRSSIVSVVFHIGKTSITFVKTSWSTAFPLLFVLATSERKVLIGSAVAVFSFLYLVLSSFVKYWTYRYSYLDEEIKLRSGLFRKKNRSMKFERIQNINIKQPFYFKPFKLVNITFETAGSKDDEGELVGITEAEADRIRDLVLSIQTSESESTTADPESEQQEPKEKLIARADPGDIIRFGLANNSLLLFAITAGPLVGVLDDFVEEDLIKNYIESITASYNPTVSEVIIGSLGLLIFAIFIFSLISVVAAFFRYNDFKLYRSQDRLRRKSGLLTTHEESLSLSKVQSITREYGLIGRLFRRENLIFDQASSANQRESTGGHLFQVPARPLPESESILKGLFDDLSFDTKLQRIHRRYIFRKWFFSYFVTMVPAGIALGMFVHYALYLLVIWAALGVPITIKRWQKWGFASHGDYAIVQRGLIGRKLVVFPLFKAQCIKYTQTPGQKRLGLANLRVYLASGSLIIPFVPLTTARQWQESILARTTLDPRPWF